MPQRTLTIDRFLGALGSDDDRDLPPGVASYALDVDPVGGVGHLRGVPGSTLKKDIGGEPVSFAVRGTDRGVYFDPGANQIYRLDTLSGTPTATSIASAVAHDGRPGVVSDGEAVRFGMGAANPPYWVGQVAGDAAETAHVAHLRTWVGTPSTNLVTLSLTENGVSLTVASVGVISGDVAPDGIPQNYFVISGDHADEFGEGDKVEITGSNNTGVYTVAFAVYDSPNTRVYVTEKISDTAATTGMTMVRRTQRDRGLWDEGAKYFYGFSVVYDGYQESPLVPNLATFVAEASTDYVGVTITQQSAASWTERITQVNLYRAENPDGKADAPFSAYRLVEQVDVSDFVGAVATVNDYNKQGQTYESRTGTPETLEHMEVHWRVGCQHEGYTFVADCAVTGLSDGENFVFRSAKGRPDVFHWARDYQKLEHTPVALVPFQGLIYAFCEGMTYRLSRDLEILDRFEGVGTFAPESVVVTEEAMFFAASRQVYAIRTRTGVPEPIGHAILYNEYDAAAGWLGHAHSASAPPCCLYDQRTGAYLLCWTNGTSNYCWAWVPDRGWFLLSLPDGDLTVENRIDGRLVTPEGHPWLIVGSHAYRLFHDETARKGYTWVSRRLGFGGDEWVPYELRIEAKGHIPTTHAVAASHSADDAAFASVSLASPAGKAYTGTSGHTYYSFATGTANADTTPPHGRVRGLRLRLVGQALGATYDEQIVKRASLRYRTIGR